MNTKKQNRSSIQINILRNFLFNDQDNSKRYSVNHFPLDKEDLREILLEKQDYTTESFEEFWDIFQSDSLMQFYCSRELLREKLKSYQFSTDSELIENL